MSEPGIDLRGKDINKKWIFSVEKWFVKIDINEVGYFALFCFISSRLFITIKGGKGLLLRKFNEASKVVEAFFLKIFDKGIRFMVNKRLNRAAKIKLKDIL